MPESAYLMNTTFRPRNLVIGTALLIGTLSASALTLGRVRGTALIGRPLDVVIQVAIEPGEDGASVCPEADVFQGDYRIDGARVTAQMVPGASPREAGVQLRTTSVIEEPVVTIYLRAGCTTKFTRRYVLLAEIPTETVAPRVVLQAPVVAPAPVRPASAATRATQPPANASVARAAPTAAPRVQVAPLAAAAAPQAVSPPKADVPVKRSRPERPEKPAKAPARPRLKLEPLDLTIEFDPVLRASNEMQSAPTADEAQRKQAAALWRAINAQPEDVLQGLQRLDTLQAEFEALKRQIVAKDAALVEIKSQLQVAEESRYANVLVYSLVGLLALLAAVAAYLGYRWRKATEGERDWWQSPDNFRGVAEDRHWGDGVDSEPAAPVLPKFHDAGLTAEVDLGLGDSTEVRHKPKVADSLGGPDSLNSGFSVSMAGGSRAVNVEELFDIQQQADFFISLGQHDQAIEVLRNHISEKAETSALAYLDLLSIYHSTQRREDYSRLRGDFNKVFNAQVPEFDAFEDMGSGLDAYENAMARIVALWPSAKVLEIIEESIFRKPGQNGGEAFDLAAYRELLLLYAMAKDIVELADGRAEAKPKSPSVSSGRDSSFRPSFAHTSIQPLSTAVLPAHAGMDDTSGASSSFGLDLDLTQPAELPSAHMGLELDATFTALGFDDPVPVLSATPEPEASLSGNLIDFDLFDEESEGDLAPKGPRAPSK